MVYLRFYVLAIILIKLAYSAEIEKQKSFTPKNSNCSHSNLPEEIFKVHNRSKDGIIVEDNEKAKDFLNLTSKVNFMAKQDDQVNSIIASINRIKKNLTNLNSKNSHDDEAIILNYPKKPDNITKSNLKVESEMKNQFLKVSSNLNGPYKERPSLKRDTTTQKTTTQKPTTQSTFVEILTIEPNNTNKFNSSANNIIEILKHLMPMFNSTLTKELHNLTIIERDRTSNHSFSAVKNISTIIVTYCDNENYTKVNFTESKPETDVKVPENSTNDFIKVDFDEDGVNMTIGERRDILEAADFGIQKMNELYTVTEPKLYSMGLWLDDGNPARYVAAFNAPSEDTARFSRYGYASLQAATKLRELVGEDDLESRTDEVQFPAASALRQSALLQHCPIRGVPKCPPASKRYRTHDGTCNNFNRPRWGSTMTPVQRFQPPVYSDGLQAPRRSVFGSNLPSAREISSTIHEDQNIETPTITHLLMQWGQFLDHDVTSSSQSRGFNGSMPRCCKDGGKDFVPKDLMHPECMPIAVPESDPFYGPKGVRCLDFVRSSPAPHDDCSLGWREQLNQVSAYIDASPLYGSSAQKSDKLRLFRNGMLQYGRVQQRRPILPPERKDELCRGGAVSSDCFKSGDGRVNEHPGLVAAHIVWLRQHNRMAQELAHLNPHWSDEKIYQETRKIVGAMVQHITYKEFLPIVLGSEVMRLFDLEPLKKGFFKKYDLKINPSPASSFGSAAFRFGHSLVQPSMMRYDRFHRPMNNNVTLHDEHSNPSNIWSMGAVDRLLLGMVNQPIQKRDEFITEELTNHLFQTPKFAFGMDLAAINIQRGRDHGMPPYTSWREPCGLSEIKGFDDLFRVIPPRTVRKLQALYRHIDDIDLFTGGMAERPVVGGLVGPTFACIIAQQFSNLRKGDRFWYENSGFESSFTPAQLQQIRRITFAQVLCRTLDTIDSIQPFAFLSHENSNNERLSCTNGHLNNFDLSPWTEIDDNDVSKDSKDEATTEKQSTTTTTSTTTEPETTTMKKEKIQPLQSFMNAMNNIPILNLVKTSIKNASQIDKESVKTNTTKTYVTQNRLNKFNMTVQKIDDKLDFKNKTRRDEDQFDHKETVDIQKRYDYDYEEDNIQSVQSVVINNHAHKRPTSHKRPVIAVTENIDKYTYLINYVPKQTTSWRQTTRRPHPDRDVVKITYQNYDDTYSRRPYKPYYYNRHDDKRDDYNYRRDRPDRYTTKKEEFHSSARSNDNDLTFENNEQKPEQTTQNAQKLVTFGYVGTYKGDDKTKAELRLDNNNLFRHDHEPLSKDFSTYDKLGQTDDSMKLSTFFSLETATKPYLKHRPTRKHDDEQTPNYLSPDSKYFYVKNVLHKYPDIEMTLTERPLLVEEKEPKTYSDSKYDFDKNIKKDDKEHAFYDEESGDAEQRTADITLDEGLFSKSAQRDRLGIKNQKPPTSAAKTPSVAFQVIPSENNPSLWAVYEEKDLPAGLPDQMPAVSSDPYASKEIPRPINLTHRKLKRKHGRK